MNKSIINSFFNKISKNDYNQKQVGQDHENWLIDEFGREYKLLKKVRELPRKTFIKASLNGKYWGEINQNFSSQFQYSDFYDFNIYEVSLKNAVYQTEIPFQQEEDLRIPREKLPKLLNTILENDGKSYALNLHEPLFSQIKFDRKLHQNDDNEVFGTIDAMVTGYILDFATEEYFEKEYRVVAPNISKSPEPPISTSKKTNIATGNVEYKGDYKRTQYFYSDYKKKYWTDWNYQRPVKADNNEGCFSLLLSIISGLFLVSFLLLFLPQFTILIPLLLILLLLHIIPPKVYQWIFRVISIIVLLMFIVSFLRAFQQPSASPYIPKPATVKTLVDDKPQLIPIKDTVNHTVSKDTLIVHYRKWQDYEGNNYEGEFWTKKRDYVKAKQFKQNFASSTATPRDYDYMIHSLKEHDRENMSGIYQLFDKIKTQKNLSKIKFAELIVSFVQDIPYTVILPDDCDPNLYDDRFIKEYLNSKNARCDGFEKFGINTPLEFLTTLKGDCDTRTLLLYTMLSHYNYDVVLLSSEFYNHSIIGVNLPIDGTAYQLQNQKYVLWETTAANIKPGIIPIEISNLNHWRISLKSK